MGLLVKFIAKIVLNGILLYILGIYFKGFVLAGGLETLIIGALALTVLNLVLKPILKLVAAPLVWMTFGLFNLVIYMAILWIADSVLTQLTITNLSTLFWTGLILGLVNAIL